MTKWVVRVEGPLGIGHRDDAAVSKLVKNPIYSEKTQDRSICLFIHITRGTVECRIGKAARFGKDDSEGKDW